MNILILGEPCSGKTALAHRLAKCLNYEHADAGLAIAAACAKSPTLDDKVKNGYHTGFTGITPWLKALPKDEVVLDGLIHSWMDLNKLKRFIPIQVVVIIRNTGHPPTYNRVKAKYSSINLNWESAFSRTYSKYTKNISNILEDIPIVIQSDTPNLERLLILMRDHIV